MKNKDINSDRKVIQCIQHENQNVNIKDTILAIKDAGFDGVFVQWYNDNTWEFSQQEQVDFCYELGLEIEFAHLGYWQIEDIWKIGDKGDQVVEGYFRDLDAIKKNNIPMVVMHLTNLYDAPPASEIGIKRFQAIADYAQKLGIKIAFENTKVITLFDSVLDNIKNKNVGICFDSGHYHCNFKDQFNWDKYKDRIFTLHLHDNDGNSDLHLLPYDGNLDWNELFKNLNNANYNGNIVLESCYSYQYLKQSLKEFYKDSLKTAKKIYEDLK